MRIKHQKLTFRWDIHENTCESSISSFHNFLAHSNTPLCPIEGFWDFWEIRVGQMILIAWPIQLY